MQQSNFVVSQAQKSNTEVRPFVDLTFEIAVPAQTLLPLQPIPMIVKQSNNTNQPVYGYSNIGFEKCPMYLEVQKIGSDKKTYITQFSAYLALTAYKNVAVPPGSQYESKEWINLGLNVDFPEPEIYSVKAVLYNENDTQSISSNTINIEIKEPTGTDQEVYNLIKNSPAKEYLFGGLYFDKVKTVLETINTRYPDSRYVKSSSFVLGEMYFRKKQYTQALTNLKRLETDGDFIFADKVKKYLKEIRRLTQIQPKTDEIQ